MKPFPWIAFSLRIASVRRLARLLSLSSCAFAAAALIAQHGTAMPANPALAGDRPDPTILRIGSEYWTASTSGDWAPVFSLSRSHDLTHWESAGSVFKAAPAWAKEDFWAPELASGPLGVYLFYAARKVDGPLCVAVATAKTPAGPYTDHGPLVCQPDGSIDPSVVVDGGKAYLIWKEDGNSIAKPSILWAKELRSDWLNTQGEAFELMRNQPDTWEGGVIEGPFILHHDGSLFLFYAGNACCGTACNYAEGVARSQHVAGPWVRDPANPIIRPNEAWHCPGHGTAVTSKSGKDYILYHAYPAKGFAYVGRESVLDAIAWSSDGWPVVNGGHGPSGNPAVQPPPAMHEEFNSVSLDPDWKWPLQRPAQYTVEHHTVALQATPEHMSFIAQSVPSLPFVATVLLPAGSTAPAGIGVVGDTERLLTLFRRGNTLSIERAHDGGVETLATVSAPPTAALWLRVEANGGSSIAFSYSADGKHWTPVGTAPLVPELLAWDRGLRVTLAVAAGDNTTHALFQHVTIEAMNK